MQESNGAAVMDERLYHIFKEVHTTVKTQFPYEAFTNEEYRLQMAGIEAVIRTALRCYGGGEEEPILEDVKPVKFFKKLIGG